MTNDAILHEKLNPILAWKNSNQQADFSSRNCTLI